MAFRLSSDRENIDRASRCLTRSWTCFGACRRSQGRYPPRYAAVQTVDANAFRRTVSATALGLSLAVHMGLLSGYHVIYHTYYIFKIPPELWRVPTSFLLTGGGLGLIFDTYFLYRYLNELEVSNRRFPRREDLIWYLICVCAGILVSLPRPVALAAPLYPRRSNTPALPRRGTSYICPHSVIPTAIAVPGNEEDHPCIRASPSFANKLRLAPGVGMVGCLYGWLGWFPILARVVFSALHLFQPFSPFLS